MDYQYKVRTREGELQLGKIEAGNEFEAIIKLQNMGLYVIDILAEAGSLRNIFGSLRTIKSREDEKKKVKRSKKLKQDDILLFCDQLGVLLNSGVDIIKALDILALQVASQKLYDIIMSIKNQVAGGQSLAVAMNKYPKVFPAFMINLIEIGESSGTLPDVMARIAVYMEKSEAIKRKIKGALTYPAVLVGVSIVAIIVFMVKIIPMFQKIFAEFNITLPELTQLVVNTSNIVRKYIIIEIILGVGAVFLFKKLLSKYEFRIKFDRIILRVPIIGTLLLRSAIVSFCTSFSVLLSNGVSVIDAIDMVRSSLGNLYLAEHFFKIKNKLRGGIALSKCLEETEDYPPMVVQMIGVGEETGKLTEMFEKISEFYDKRVSSALDALTSIFEPLILVVMGGIIGTLVISMFLPIFKLSQIGSGGGM